MKRCLLITCICILTIPHKAPAQTDEAQQLLLNVEKLAQLKKILHNMYQGYQIVSKGYNTIKDISKGNFSIHQAFLNGLMQVSPTVRKYKKIADVISYQGQLVEQYKAAFKRFKSSNLFNASEIKYMGVVYDNLFHKSLQNLDELAMVITAGKLRMSDDERLTAIDRVFDDVAEKLNFLKTFNKENDLLAIQRSRELFETRVSKKVNGL